MKSNHARHPHHPPAPPRLRLAQRKAQTGSMPLLYNQFTGKRKCIMKQNPSPQQVNERISQLESEIQQLQSELAVLRSQKLVGALLQADTPLFAKTAPSSAPNRG